MRLTLAILAAACFLLAVGSLVSGAEWLSVTISQPFPLPLGQLVAAALYVSLTALTVLASRGGTLPRVAGWLLLSTAVLWLPLSIWLAGNLNLNFTTSSWRSEVWIWYTFAVLPGGSVLLLVWELVRRVLHRFKRAAGPLPALIAHGERH